MSMGWRLVFAINGAVGIGCMVQAAIRQDAFPLLIIGELDLALALFAVTSAFRKST